MSKHTYTHQGRVVGTGMFKHRPPEVLFLRPTTLYWVATSGAKFRKSDGGLVSGDSELKLVKTSIRRVK